MTSSANAREQILMYLIGVASANPLASLSIIVYVGIVTYAIVLPAIWPGHILAQAAKVLQRRKDIFARHDTRGMNGRLLQAYGRDVARLERYTPRSSGAELTC